MHLHPGMSLVRQPTIRVDTTCDRCARVGKAIVTNTFAEQTNDLDELQNDACRIRHRPTLLAQLGHSTTKSQQQTPSIEETTRNAFFTQPRSIGSRQVTASSTSLGEKNLSEPRVISKVTRNPGRACASRAS